MPNIIQRLYRGVVWRLTPKEKTIYLTFDDGCIPQVTPKVLEILRRYNIKATFFMVGDNIRKYPEIFKLVAQEGHTIGNHTFNHINGYKSSTAEYLNNVSKTDDLLDRLHPEGSQRLRLLRPPYGKMRYSQKKELQQTHTLILWDLITHDYNKKYTPEKILRLIKRYSRNGSIIVFHDSLKAEKNMLATLPQAIDYWLSEGYSIKPIGLTSLRKHR